MKFKLLCLIALATTATAFYDLQKVLKALWRIPTQLKNVEQAIDEVDGVHPNTAVFSSLNELANVFDKLHMELSTSFVINASTDTRVIITHMFRVDEDIAITMNDLIDKRPAFEKMPDTIPRLRSTLDSVKTSAAGMGNGFSVIFQDSTRDELEEIWSIFDNIDHTFGKAVAAYSDEP